MSDTNKGYVNSVSLKGFLFSDPKRFKDDDGNESFVAFTLVTKSKVVKRDGSEFEFDSYHNINSYDPSYVPASLSKDQWVELRNARITHRKVNDKYYTNITLTENLVVDS